MWKFDRLKLSLKPYLGEKIWPCCHKQYISWRSIGTLADLTQPHARTIFSHAVGSPLICWNGMAHARLVSTLGHELDRSAGGYCACAGRGLGYLVCPLVCAVISPFCEIVMTGATRRELTARQGAPLDLYPRVNGEGGEQVAKFRFQIYYLFKNLLYSV